jgi:hypothetical protein
LRGFPLVAQEASSPLRPSLISRLPPNFCPKFKTEVVLTYHIVLIYPYLPTTYDHTGYIRRRAIFLRPSNLFDDNALRENEKKILTYLAVSGDANRYELKGKLHLSYSGVHETVKRMLEPGFGWIQIQSSGRKRGRGQTLKLGLTLQGFMLAFYHNRKKWKEEPALLDTVISKNSSLLPEVLGAWKEFEKHQVSDLALEKLDQIYWIQSNNEKLADEIIKEFTSVNSEKPSIDDQRWLKAVCQIPRLKRLVAAELEKMEESFRSQKTRLEQELQRIQDFKKSLLSRPWNFHI